MTRARDPDHATGSGHAFGLDAARRAPNTRGMSAPLPHARVVRKGGVAVAPPPGPMRERLAALEAGLGPRTRDALAAIIGLWPVTAVLLLALGLMWLSVMNA